MPWPLPSPNRAITEQLNRIERNQEKIMSGLSDLTNAEQQEAADINTLIGVVSTMISDVQAALANDDADAAVEAAAQVVAQQDAQLQAVVAQLQAADPGAPTPAPAPATPPAGS
jgi:uncharacterized coiled-coil protein SlyX